MRGKLLFAAAGAAAMYFFDPDQGRARRARLRIKLDAAKHRAEERRERGASVVDLTGDTPDGSVAAAYGTGAPVSVVPPPGTAV